MEENLAQKIQNVGSDTIMGAMSNFNQKENQENIDNLADAIEESQLSEQESKNAAAAAMGANVDYAQYMQYLKNRKPIKKDYNISRNDPCPCGATDENGKPIKYKNCCLNSGRYETYSR